MAYQIQLRRGLSGDWTNNNPILAQGEPGLEIGTNKLKIGDGTTSWTSLSYFGDYQTISFNESTALFTISNGNTVSLSALSGGGGTLTNETDPVFSTWGQANSGNYDLAYHTILTGGNIGGNLTVNGQVSSATMGTGLIDFIPLTSAAHINGRLYYNTNEHTLIFVDEDPVLTFPLNKMLWTIGINKTNTTIPKGTVVYLSGAQGNRGKMWPALATSDYRSADTIGVTMGETLDNQEGYIMTIGVLEGINTSNFGEGVTLYLSPTAEGGITDVKPQAPNHIVKVGFALNSTNNGKIYVEIDNGYEIDELHNVRIDNIANGQGLVYDSTSALWVNSNLYNGSDLKVLSANWQNTYTTVNTNSSNWNYQGTDIKALTSNWQNTYTTVNTNSSNWNYQGTDIKALTSNWQNTYTTVNTNSSRYDSVFTTVNANSASWGTGGTGGGSLSGISYNRWSFTGSPPTSAFSIPGATSETEEAYRVTIDFLLQDPLSYTVSGTNITFSEAPPLSSNIVVVESYATAGTGGSSTGGTKTYAVFTPLDAQPPATNFATLDTRNSIAVLDFDATTEESTTFVGILPEGANVSSGLKVRMHWTATTATTGSCRWGVQFEKAGTDIDSDSFDTATENHSTTNGTAGIETITEITATTIDSITAGDRFRIKVYRDATDATNDTMTGDAELIAVEIRSAV